MFKIGSAQAFLGGRLGGSLGSLVNLSQTKSGGAFLDTWLSLPRDVGLMPMA
jgi:hypothetical protein